MSIFCLEFLSKSFELQDLVFGCLLVIGIVDDLLCCFFAFAPCFSSRLAGSDAVLRYLWTLMDVCAESSNFLLGYLRIRNSSILDPKIDTSKALNPNFGSLKASHSFGRKSGLKFGERLDYTLRT